VKHAMRTGARTTSLDLHLIEVKSTSGEPELGGQGTELSWSSVAEQPGESSDQGRFRL